MPSAPKVYSTALTTRISNVNWPVASIRGTTTAVVRLETPRPSSTNATRPAPIIRRSISTAAYIAPAAASTIAEMR